MALATRSTQQKKRGAAASLWAVDADEKLLGVQIPHHQMAPIWERTTGAARLAARDGGCTAMMIAGVRCGAVFLGELPQSTVGGC